MGIFEGFSAADIDRITSIGTPVTLPEGWSPIWEQTPADKAFVILSGEVSVRRGGREVARLGPGEIVGEAGIVEHKLRNASVVALSQLELLHFSDDQLTRLTDECPAFREAIQRQARERLGAGQQA